MNQSSGYPNEWADDQVMDVLFSPFRGSRDVNPRSWDSKMKFWTDMVRKHCADKRSLTIDARSLTQVFERNGKVPTCLNVVLDDLKRRGVIQTLSDYYASADTSWLSWSVNVFVKRPVQWSYNNVIKKSLSWAYGLVVGKTVDDTYRPKSRTELLHSLPDEQYVLLELVKTAADAIYQRHRDSVIYNITDNVIEYSALRAGCKDICSDEQSFQVAILELMRQKLCTVATSSEGERLIRMVLDKKDTAAPLSESEEKIYRLKAALRKLEENISKITEEMEQCRKTAKTYLQQEKKSQALKCLKRKKLLAVSLAQKEQAVDKINSLIDNIQQTESQKQIIDAYAAGVHAFKDLTKKHGLTEDKIDSTMLDIQEAFEVNDQMNQALAQPVVDFGDLAESDLEDELAEILRVKPDATPRDDRATLPELRLPNVPEHEPAFSSSIPARPTTSRAHGPVLYDD